MLEHQVANSAATLRVPKKGSKMKPALKYLSISLSAVLVCLCGTASAQTVISGNAHPTAVTNPPAQLTLTQTTSIPVGSGCISGNCGGRTTYAQPVNSYPVNSYPVASSVPQSTGVHYTMSAPISYAPTSYTSAPQWQPVQSCANGSCSRSYTRSQCRSCRRR